jgi:hypothetical protein
MKNGGDDFSILNHSKVLELKEGSEVFRSFSNALFEFSQLPLRNLVFPQLFVLDLVILRPGFSWHINCLVQLLDNSFLFLVQMLLNTNLILNILVKQLFLFVLPTISKVLD